MFSRKKLILILLLLVGLWSLGIAGYVIIEGWSILDAIYMTVISLTTVGYGEVHPLSSAGKIFTIALLAMGLGLFSYSIGVLAEATIEGHFKGILGRKRMQKAIDKLNNHFIICGYGRIGKTIQRTISERNIPLVIVEKDPEVVQDMQDSDLLYVEGDATHDEVLVRAGVKRAKGIICVLHTDADNVYVTLTARSLAPGLLIVARADDTNAEKKMIQAGADRVISPYEIGAKRMALAVLQPTVTEFLDLAVHSIRFDLTIEQIQIQEDSKLDGMSLKKAAIRQKTGCTVLAVQRAEGAMIISPDPNTVLGSGDIVVTLGTKHGLEAFKRLAGASEVDRYR